MRYFDVSDDIPNDCPPAVQISRNHNFDDPGMVAGLFRSARIVRGGSSASPSQRMETVCLKETKWQNDRGRERMILYFFSFLIPRILSLLCCSC